MLQLIYEQASEFVPLTEMTVRGLHHELLQFYESAKHYRGRYKVASNSVVQRDMATGEQFPVLQTSPPGPLTDSAMTDLLRWYNDSLSGYPWTIAIATEFVFRFLAIHPFQDGNGRLGRGLYLLTLLQSPDETLKNVVPFLPIDRHIEKRREAIILHCGAAPMESLGMTLARTRMSPC